MATRMQPQLEPAAAAARGSIDSVALVYKNVGVVPPPLQAGAIETTTIAASDAPTTGTTANKAPPQHPEQGRAVREEDELPPKEDGRTSAGEKSRDTAAATTIAATGEGSEGETTSLALATTAVSQSLTPKTHDGPTPPADDAAVVAVPATAAPGSTSAVSRTICLRGLRANTAQSSSSSSGATGGAGGLAGWGGKGAVVPSGGASASVEQGNEGRGFPASSAEATAAAAAGQVRVADGATGGAGGGAGVAAPLANKVVDLREVKKVRPGPLAADVSNAAKEYGGFDGTEGEEDAGGGLVKVDLSAGKRMIEFQLKMNAAEEKREAARAKSEKDRTDAAITEGSQRVLAQINARMESQRRGRGAGGGSGILGAWDNSTGGGGNNSNSQQHVNGGADGVIAQDCIRNLAEKHGIVVRFIDKGHASGEAQLKALARLHGIRIQILGQVDGGGGGVACGNNKEMDVETATTAEAGHGIYTAAAGGGGGGGGGEGGGGGGVWATVTPPPMLASLRPRASIVRSSSTVVAQSGLKAAPRKAPAEPTASTGAKEGGIFSGPARMMRRALQASSGGFAPPPPSKDAAPAVPSKRSDDAMPTSSDDNKVGGVTTAAGDVKRAPAVVSTPSASAAVARMSKLGTRQLTSTPSEGGSIRESGQSIPASDVATVPSALFSSGRKRILGPSASDSRVAGSGRSSSSSSSTSSVSSSRCGGGGAGAPNDCYNGGSTESSGGRKRREAPGSSDGQEEDGGSRALTTPRTVRTTGGGDGSLGSAGERRVRAGVNSLGGDGAAAGAAMGTGVVVPAVSSAPKRMRLVPPAGGVMSQPSSQTTTPAATLRVNRKATSGGGWTPGNNNLFKGAMAGIIGRGRRPAS